MSSRRYHSKYLASRHYKRMRRLKFVGMLLLTFSLVAGGAFLFFYYFDHHGEIHPTTDIKLGDDN